MSENETINQSAENSNAGNIEFLLSDVKKPNGEKLTSIIAQAKTFSSGREGFFAQIAPFVLNGKVYGGQLQIWEKTPKK